MLMVAALSRTLGKKAIVRPVRHHPVTDADYADASTRRRV